MVNCQAKPYLSLVFGYPLCLGLRMRYLSLDRMISSLLCFRLARELISSSCQCHVIGSIGVRTGRTETGSITLSNSKEYRMWPSLSNLVYLL